MLNALTLSYIFVILFYVTNVTKYKVLYGGEHMTAISHKLKEMALFQDCSQNDIDLFLTCTKPLEKTYASGSYLLLQGEYPKSLWLILDGTLDIMQTTNAGTQIIIDALKDGDIYGQLNIFNDATPSDVEIVSKTASTLLSFPAHAFYQPCSNACHAHHMIIKNMLAILAQQAVRLSQKVSWLSATTLKGKIARYLLSETHKQGSLNIILDQNRESLAKILSTTRPSLSRALSELSKDGYLNFHKNHITILNKEALAILE